MLERWRDLFGAVGESFLDLLWAEIEELESDLGRSGRLLLRALVALVVAGVLGFYASAAAGVLLVVLLNHVWPLWAAVLAVTLGLLLLAGIAAAVGTRWLRRLESPVSTVRRRVDDHLQWWQQELLRGEGAAQGGEAKDEAPTAGESG